LARHPIQSAISPQLRESQQPSPDLPSLFPSHSPPFTSVREGPPGLPLRWLRTVAI
jgi:hypothetical protein